MSAVADLVTVNQIVAVGSVDGILTTAALLSYIGPEKQVYVQFTTAMQVNTLRVDWWRANRRVALVNLGVNFNDVFSTRQFIDQIYRRQHTIVAIIDEHNRELWQAVMAPYRQLSTLAVEPQTQSTASGIHSSGAVFLAALGHEATEHQQQLLAAAEAADRGNFSSPFASMVNRAIKPDLHNQRRRVYVARHFAKAALPDAQIERWIAEYLPLQKNAQDIFHARSNLGEGVIRLVLNGRPVDMTDLNMRVWMSGARVLVLSHHPSGIDDEYTTPTVIRAKYPWLDLVRIMNQADVAVLTGGARSRISVRPHDEWSAVEAIRHAIMRHEYAANPADDAPVVVMPAIMAE